MKIMHNISYLFIFHKKDVKRKGNGIFVIANPCPRQDCITASTRTLEITFRKRIVIEAYRTSYFVNLISSRPRQLHASIRFVVPVKSANWSLWIIVTVARKPICSRTFLLAFPCYPFYEILINTIY